MSAESRAAAAKKRKRNTKLWQRSHRYADKAAFHGIRWESRSHRQLFEMIMTANPRQMDRMAADWSTLSRDIRQTTDEVHATMNRLLGSWTGRSANTAAASTASLAQWATQASEIAARIGTGLNHYTEAVAHAQHRMPPPPTSGGFLSGFHTGGVTVPNAAMVIGELVTDQKATDEENKAAKAQAVRVMQQYAHESQHVHDTMPWFYDAPPPQYIAPDVHTEEAPRPEPKPEPVPGQDGSGVAGDIDGDGVSDTTAPESFTPTPSTGPGPSGGGYAPGFGVPAGGGGGDGPRGGGAFGGGGVFGPGGPGPGAGGLSGVGSPAAARAGMPAPGVPGAGPGGSNSFFPPMGAGAGVGREEDKDHKNKYDDGLDLLDDLPPHFPPVFGV
jgi:uncharacterized protein YukE